jgi:uncharacterized protein YcbX
MDPLKIPLAADAEQYATIDGVGVWDWSGSAYDEGPEAAEWFSSYLGKPSWLVRFKEGFEIDSDLVLHYMPSHFCCSAILSVT